MAKLDDDMVSIENGWRKREEYLINGPLDEEKYTTYENPFVFKRKDKYYYLLSIFNKTEEGGPDVVEGQYVHYWIGDSPMGPFKYQDVLFDPDDGHTALGNIGTSVVKYKDQWLFFYHERFHTPERGCTERKPCMDTLHFNDKGLMKVAGKEK
jgi:beta-xylosidase